MDVPADRRLYRRSGKRGAAMPRPFVCKPRQDARFCKHGANMSRAYNFSAGPAALPEPVLRQAQAEMLDWDKARASVMEISHRGKEFIALAQKSEQDLRALMQIPQSYKVLFLQGGATQHFAQIPMNFARRDQAVDYVLTGAWGEKASKEAKPLAKVQIAASSEANKFTTIPPRA